MKVIIFKAKIYRIIGFKLSTSTNKAKNSGIA